MRKKLSLWLCLVVMALAMTACGESAEDAGYFGMSEAEWQASMEQEVSALLALDEESKQSIQLYGNDIAIGLVASWDEATADLGAYQGLGECTVTKAQDTLTVEQNVQFETREVVITYVYSYNYESEQVELVDANADLVYTMGEKMSKAGLNTLMGMGTVFVVLILISLIIYCFKLIPYIQEKFTKKTAAEPGAGTQAAAPRPQQAAGTQAAVGAQAAETQADDLELAAVIAAAVAAASGVPADGFVVRSIRRR